MNWPTAFAVVGVAWAVVALTIVIAVAVYQEKQAYRATEFPIAPPPDTSGRLAPPRPARDQATKSYAERQRTQETPIEREQP